MAYGRHQRWHDPASGQKRAVVVGGAVQIGLAVAAWCDLARRSDDRVNGTKRFWAFAIGVNFIGPVAYFIRGRKRR